MRSKCLFFWLLIFAASTPACLNAAEPKLKPRHDPPEQLFRRAPMVESARSIVVNLATNLHYAFDPDLVRVHTVWMGTPLNLWGPPYSYAKAPFICDFQGKVFYSFPQVSPWWLGGQSVKTRFRAIDTKDGVISFSYDLVLGMDRIPVVEQANGNADLSGWMLQRKFQFPQGCPSELELLLFAEGGASGEESSNGVQVRSTNGLCQLSARIEGASQRIIIRRENVNYERLLITEEGTEKGFSPTRVTGEEFRVRVAIPRRTDRFSLEVELSHGAVPATKKEPVQAVSKIFSASSELRAPGGDDSYKIEYFPLPPEAELLITGMDWMPNGDLAVCTWLGEIYLVQGVTGDIRKATYQRIASGLIEPLGLAVNKGDIFVVQKGELTKIVDADADGVADRFECINSSWGFSGNYHSYSFGPLITPQNDIFVFVAGQRGLYDLLYQGWALKISADGENVQPFCSGLRVPHGWGFYGRNEIFTTDNQGNWIGACRLNRLKPHRFYGFPSSRPAPKTTPRAEDVEQPVLWFPRSLSPSASGFDTIDDDRFGPFHGQLLIGDFQNSIVMRAALERIGDSEDGVWQGAVFPFAKGFLSGVNRLKMGPDGKLYVGGGKRTWSTAAPKEFSLDRVSFTGKTPFEAQAVRARKDGFDLVFTKPVDQKSAGDVGNYVVKQFTYKYQPEYGSPEFDHNGKVGATETPVTKIQILDDGVTVRLTIPTLRTGFVTSFQVAVSSAEDEDLRNETFYYTLNARPSQ
jgi:glucose/arabinose dehydrogenase